MPFELAPLPYPTTALAPHMSAETIEYHYGKHNMAYVTKTNELADAKGLSGRSLVEVVRASGGSGPLFNNAGQLWNHNFFWQCLSPEKHQPSGKLLQLIEDGYGSLGELEARFTAEAVGHFASGWALLVLKDGKIEVTSLHDGDTAAAHEGMQPLFALDLWEHSYYIDYRNARPKYVAAVFDNLIDWDFVAQNLDGQGVSRGDQQS